MLNLDHQIIEGYPQNAGLDLEQHRMHREDYVVNIDDVLRALDRVDRIPANASQSSP